MVRFPRRQFLALAAGAAALPALSRIASAQSYPSRLVTVIVPSGAGAPTDVTARIVIEHMRGTLGQVLVQRFRDSNHIRRPDRAYRTKCGRRDGG
jgi:hypothetical protein